MVGEGSLWLSLLGCSNPMGTQYVSIIGIWTHYGVKGL